jgi:hypothetical protein
MLKQLRLADSASFLSSAKFLQGIFYVEIERLSESNVAKSALR